MYVAEGDNIGVYQSDDGLNWSNANGNQADSKIASSTFSKDYRLKHLSNALL
ncbi:hypothetical protein SDC49_09325 [Lactobacillus sp. R2/2]|nr:hypothetical protein [Lactobacillus sp. R2/2]